MLITVKVTAFPHMMRRELKGLKLNSCAALRKPLISETNWEKRLHFDTEHKHWTHTKKKNRR